jgi:hypothetical protein
VYQRRAHAICCGAGNPQKNGIKFFATSELLELVKDRAWLVKMTNAVNQHWQKNNASKRNRSANGSDMQIGKGSLI